MEKTIQIYKTLTQIPTLTGAKLSNSSVVSSFWSQRNIESGKNIKSLIQHVLDQNKVIFSSIPVDITNESLIRSSPSEKYKAVIRDLENKEGKKQFLEIWEQPSLIRSVDLKALDLHGDIYTDIDFSSLDWSQSENSIIYVAEKKQKKSEPFYKRKGKKNDNEAEISIGTEYLYIEEWGEQLVGKKESVIAHYNLESDSVTILEGIPQNVCPAQPIWSPDESYIVGVAYKTLPRKLGMVYCTNRVSTIFTLDLNGKYVELSLENQCVKSPRFTPDGNHLIWLQRKAGGPHASAMTLCKASIPLTETTVPEVIVDIVETSLTINDGKLFYGLYNSTFPKRCWSNDGRLILSTVQKNTVNTYIVEIDSGKIHELQYEEGSQIVLDVLDDTILVARKNFLKPDKLTIAKIPPKGEENIISWTDITQPQHIESIQNCNYQYMELIHESNDEIRNFTSIYIGPMTGAESEVPLIVWPHGGPHSSFSNSYALEFALFLSLGYGLLLVNFRGSIGAGKKSVDFLLGKVGTSDVADCILATQKALTQFPWLDSKRVSLVGGSHGGFLVTHLSGQYPDMFTAVVARNPVIDIASMSVISDIPDWCYVEAGAEYTQVGQPDEELLIKMRKASPIQHAHKVKAPTFLQIGSKDLRVPPSQGAEFYTRLKANNVTVRMNLYDDNHPIGGVLNEMDKLINTAIWIQEHTAK